MGERLHYVLGADWIKTGFHGNRWLSLTFNGDIGVTELAAPFLIGSSSNLQVISL